ncbi:MAG: addiction module protein [Thiohalomonas sp.]|nr:addiction module protein [Thiohalomonas sp.]
MNTNEIKKMSSIERLKTMEALWDSLTSDSRDSAPPEWHKDVLDKRKSKIETGEAEFISIKKLKANF